MADHDDVEVENFEITDMDLMHGFGLGFRRRKMTKEEAIYGMWAEKDSDEDDIPSGYTGRRKKDYSKPLNFVSGGIVQKGKDKNKEDDDAVSVGSSASDRGGGSGRSSPVVKDKKLFKNSGSKKDISSLGPQMGYQPGKGLGKEGQGIVLPVEAFKREGRGALGSYGPERSKKAQELRPHYDEEEEEEKFKEQLQQWKKTEDGGYSKPKYVYKTADEVKASGGAKKGPSISLKHSKIKVVDMTGPETKILTGYSSLAQQHAKPGEVPPTTSEAAFAMPELTYNLNLLIELAETDIIQTDRQLKYECDLVVNLKHEEEKLNVVLEREEKDIKRLMDIITMIDRCRQQSLSSDDDALTLDKCEEIFNTLQEDYYEEFKLRNHFQGWNPLVDPSHGLEVMVRWQEILEKKEAENSAFTQTLTQGLSHGDENSWSPRDSDSMLNLVNVWSPVLPQWILENIRDQLVLPRLQAEVDAWNPLTDTVPVHAWIHPWLPFMGDHLEPLYAPVRFKLASALTNWHPSDPSAKMILEPWTKVFSKGTMDAFILRSIYPKLSQCLSEFIINPHQQHLEPFHWVMEWKDIIAQQHFISLLEKHFFPRWIQVLRGWLSVSPNYDEVIQWYSGWKGMFSEDLHNNPSIKVHFNRALDMMNQAVTSPGGFLQPGAKENIAYLTSTERRREAEAAAIAAAAEKQRAESARNVASQNVPSNFKDLIQNLAEENSLLFMPIPNRRYEGKALYSLGKLTLYIDRGVVFVNLQGVWKPVSLQDLMIMAK
ncbi:Tuftelin-interacting protein 11 [Acropora cervicornis]|uniref:Tuftelin-interacting protein 11 n=1 Tax=Acropora cervicornis TaxID=6130 RepID=A0AAD9V841_ACRCE|nr:Tuftelin-interacting protein 11 [Acropora cervicornis]